MAEELRKHSGELIENMVEKLIGSMIVKKTTANEDAVSRCQAEVFCRHKCGLDGRSGGARLWKRGLLGRRLPLFSKGDLRCLDSEYFSIIMADAYDVTIISRNTGHYWYLNNPEYPGI